MFLDKNGSPFRDQKLQSHTAQNHRDQKHKISSNKWDNWVTPAFTLFDPRHIYIFFLLETQYKVWFNAYTVS